MISCRAGALAANGLAHLPPFLARRQTYNSTIFCKVPLHTHAEGGQVEPMLGGAKTREN